MISDHGKPSTRLVKKILLGMSAPETLCSKMPVTVTSTGRIGLRLR